MNKMQALHHFWSEFSIPAYEATSVPDEKDRVAINGQAFPYLTYEASTDDFGNALAQTASLWYRDTSWAAITAKEQEISDFITRGGRMVAYTGGAMWIRKASPWAQRLEEPSDDTVRRMILNVQVEFLD